MQESIISLSSSSLDPHSLRSPSDSDKGGSRVKSISYMDSNPCSPNDSKIYRGLRLPSGWNGDKGLALTMHLHSKTPTHFYLEFIYLRWLRVKITCSPSGPTMGLSFSLCFLIHKVGMPVSCGLVSFIYSGHNTRNSESPTKHS